MNLTVKLVALTLGFSGLLLAVVALNDNNWRTSTVNWNVITTSTIYENLWHSCVRDWKGVHKCEELPPLLALSGYIHTSRALMITSILLGTFGLVAALIELLCSKAAGDSVVLKGRISGTAGVFFILQGICTLVSVSLYCFTKDFFDPFYPRIRYELGEGPYIGFGSAVLAVTGGICGIYYCRMCSKEKYPFPYQIRGTGDSRAAPSGGAGESTYEISTCV